LLTVSTGIFKAAIASGLITARGSLAACNLG